MITLQEVIEKCPILLSQYWKNEWLDGNIIISYFVGINNIFASCISAFKGILKLGKGERGLSPALKPQPTILFLKTQIVKNVFFFSYLYPLRAFSNRACSFSKTCKSHKNYQGEACVLVPGVFCLQAHFLFISAFKGAYWISSDSSFIQYCVAILDLSLVLSI